MSSHAESLEKVFPIVDNSTIRYGDKFTVRIPKRKLNETTRALQVEIANQENMDKEEKTKRERYIESIINEKLRKTKFNGEEGDSREHIEQLKLQIQKEIDEIATQDGKHVLDHVSPYVEEPFVILDSYFNAQHLERLVRHQIES